MILFRCAKRSILPDRITLLEVTSTGASFDLLRHRKRARKVTVRIPQRKVTKFKLSLSEGVNFAIQQIQNLELFFHNPWIRFLFISQSSKIIHACL